MVEQLTVYRAQIVLPLCFDVDERPLAAAEREMLQAGEREEHFVQTGHPMRVQVTPAGRAASSTVTV